MQCHPNELFVSWHANKNAAQDGSRETVLHGHVYVPSLFFLFLSSFDRVRSREAAAGGPSKNHRAVPSRPPLRSAQGSVSPRITAAVSPAKGNERKDHQDSISQGVDAVGRC